MQAVERFGVISYPLMLCEETCEPHLVEPSYLLCQSPLFNTGRTWLAITLDAPDLPPLPLNYLIASILVTFSKA